MGANGNRECIEHAHPASSAEAYSYKVLFVDVQYHTPITSLRRLSLTRSYSLHYRSLALCSLLCAEDGATVRVTNQGGPTAHQFRDRHMSKD